MEMSGMGKKTCNCEKVYVIHWVRLDRYSSVEKDYKSGARWLEQLVARVHDIESPKISPGTLTLQPQQFGPYLTNSNMPSEAYKNIVKEAKGHILSGDIFQIVLSQRFERRTLADPFGIYISLRAGQRMHTAGFQSRDSDECKEEKDCEMAVTARRSRKESGRRQTGGGSASGG